MVMWIRTLYYLKKSFDTLEFTNDEIFDFQKRRLKDIIETCNEQSFYRDHWNEKPEARDIMEGAGSPVLDAKDLRAGKSTPLDKGITGLSRQTSGTSGNQVSIDFDRKAHEWLSIIHFRTLYLQGYRPPKNISQYPRDMEDQRSLIGKKLVPKRYIDDSRTVDEQIDLLEEQDPDVLQYFPQMLAAVSKKINASEGSSLNPELVLTYGEPITASLRNYIEDTFNAPVRDQYGTAEFGTVAWECPENGYHVMEDAVFMELLNGEGEKVEAGETGRVVISGLANKETPLIRYWNGDMATRAEDPCSCDTCFKRLKNIRGRQKDVFYNADGDPVFPDQLIEVVSPAETVLFWQVVAMDGRYVLRYVPFEDTDSTPLEEIEDRLENQLSLEPLETEEVKSIPKNSGKVRVIENRQSNTPTPGEMF